ncbi:Transcriptional regulator NrdR [Commensalibacter communis]|uniref:Transcriptional repressor NrdR n=1 Tax=Commensalibacter communis TaxID=2972786 RepID=A0A9W4TN08_9PROT|nr:transcriptional regulator NrdR [Commensalibacter communis]CAI3924063.1 Transcriptional regulator NrdR [Commensalibacter communis]CAI3928014.1 Transcriptional regulator NrdR [Commensalibacter communis]CAI3928589.1 Transcriptional regulator NrdR [Commensalibacter communis]CAI3932857.1 Transcriptional regulator NrdR [Commensalibacter communis]CAI3934182.1 Transcriptional regulator NrdR [Commensalibacter communis]
MFCPFCGNEDTMVKDSRSTEDGTAIRRRRVCTKCNERFTTLERVQTRELLVLKRSGQRVPFEKEKLIRSIDLATRKRPISAEQIDQIANKLEKQFVDSGENVITSESIGKTTMELLKDIDKVAYVRFASVYSDFKNVKDFAEILQTMEHHDK